MAKQFDPKRTTGAAKGLPGYPGSFKGQLPNESIHRPRFNVNPIPVTNNQPAQGAWGSSSYALALDMVRYDNTVATVFSTNFGLTILSPSARLRIAINSVLDCPTKDASQSFSNAAGAGGRLSGSGWRMWPGIQNPITGKVTIQGPRIQLGNADPAFPPIGSGPLPARGGDPLDFGVSYEADSAASAYMIQGTCQFNDLSILVVAATDKVTLKYVVTWEPNCEINSEELKLLFSKCRMVYGSPGAPPTNVAAGGTGVQGIFSAPTV